MNKCNLCYSGLIEGRQPACSSACPTGALKFGQMTNPDSGIAYNWFPDKKLNPSIEFTSIQSSPLLKIIPEYVHGAADSEPSNEIKNISAELSLIIFSFLATLSVSVVVSSFIRGLFPEKKILIPLILLTGMISFFHLGRKLRSWRSVINLKNSPLSREIAGFIVYSGVSFIAMFYSLPGFLIAALITGLIFLLLIDNVYLYADRSKSVILHSGQTFASALIIASFITGLILPFIFMALIKSGLTIYSLTSRKPNRVYFGIRFLRMIFLIIPGISLITHNSFPDMGITFIFLIGELIDRFLYYLDFNPLSISTLIKDQSNIMKDEKKRG